MKRTIAIGAAALALATVLSACSADTTPPATTPGTTAPNTGTPTDTAPADQEINVLMVGNPQMNDLETLTAANFTAQTGIKVNYTILPENELRDKVSTDIANQAGQYDVATIGAYEAAVWTSNDWLTNLQPYAEGDAAFDVGDIMPSMSGILSKDGDMYAIPFYGESAFTMYRKDLFDQWGLTMPANPTWAEIADLAAQIKTKDDTIAPICLRGLPGWGENMAVIGAMMNAFGGGFFDADWNPLMTSDGTRAAVQAYVDIVTQYGESGAPQAGFTECLTAFSQGQAAMWFDATSAATTLESSASTVAGKVGYADAPKDQLRSGWVWAWAWAIPKTTQHVDAAWQFVAWASSKEYEQLALAEVGRVPDGKRVSTASIPEYQAATAAYLEPMMAAIEAADPTNCQAQPSPGPGCQYLGIPEFSDLGAKIGQEMAAALTGAKTVDQVLTDSQALAQAVADDNK
jgi:sorbitol/mannitol transport system substrate-binding protein